MAAEEEFADPVGAIEKIDQLEKDLDAAEARVKAFYNLVNEASREQQSVKKVSLRLHKEVPAVAKGLTKEQLRELEPRIQALRQRTRNLKSVVPETRSFFCRLMLGRVNLKVWTPSERERLREEYHKFKFRTNIIFIALPVIVLLSH